MEEPTMSKSKKTYEEQDVRKSTVPTEGGTLTDIYDPTTGVGVTHTNTTTAQHLNAYSG